MDDNMPLMLSPGSVIFSSLPVCLCTIEYDNHICQDIVISELQNMVIALRDLPRSWYLNLYVLLHHNSDAN